jgi:hypothetical protein
MQDQIRFDPDLRHNFNTGQDPDPDLSRPGPKKLLYCTAKFYLNWSKRFYIFVSLFQNFCISPLFYSTYIFIHLALSLVVEER